MSIFFVMKNKKEVAAFERYSSAVAKADELFRQTKEKHDVQERKMVYTTQTLQDALLNDEERRS